MVDRVAASVIIVVWTDFVKPKLFSSLLYSMWKNSMSQKACLPR